MTEPLLKVEGLTKHFPVVRGLLSRVVGQVQAVEGVTFELMPGETLGLVGESGCGKTTLGRTILRLLEPSSGRIVFDGKDVTAMGQEELRVQRQQMQIIFQDPFSSLNPRMRVLDIVGEALQVHGIAQGAEVERQVIALLKRVGVPASWVNRYPHEFSGGQRQRIGVARALALHPKLIVCDEAVSALDVSVQAQVINLLIELREEFGLAYLFVAHDLSVVRHISDRIAVMYLGQIVELCPAQDLFDAPLHPYTQALLSAIPIPDPRRRGQRVELQGDVPTPLNPPAGCRFHTRCPAVLQRCKTEEPPLLALRLGKGADSAPHQVKCFHASEALEAAGDGESLAAEIQRRALESTRRNRQAREDDASVSVAEVLGEAAEQCSPETGLNVALPPAPIPQKTTGRRNRQEKPTTGGELSNQQKDALGAALLTVALALTFFGWWALAGLVLPAAVWFCRHRLRGKHAIAAPLLFLAFGGLLWFGDARRAVKLAREQLAQLGAEVENYAEHKGELPRSLGDLGWRLYPIVEQGNLADPWGKPYLYRTPGTDGRAFDLGSTGPDKKRSHDDLGHLPPPNPIADDLTTP